MSGLVTTRRLRSFEARRCAEYTHPRLGMRIHSLALTHPRIYSVIARLSPAHTSHIIASHRTAQAHPGFPRSRLFFARTRARAMIPPQSFSCIMRPVPRSPAITHRHRRFPSFVASHITLPLLHAVVLLRTRSSHPSSLTPLPPCPTSPPIVTFSLRPCPMSSPPCSMSPPVPRPPSILIPVPCPPVLSFLLRVHRFPCLCMLCSTL